MAAIVSIRKNSPGNFKFCKKVSALAAGAAQITGADVRLTQTAALYTDIGRLLGEKNISNTRTAAEAAGLPEKLVTVVCEAVDKDISSVKTKEAAMIILSVAVQSSFSYLRVKLKSDASAEKIVDAAIGKKVMTGFLNDCGISVRDCSTLRAYFISRLESL